MAHELSDGAVLDAFPNAAIDHDNIEFYRGILNRRYLVNRCRNCGHWHAPPRSMCPVCWSDAVTPTEIAGTGTVYMIVWLHQGAPVPHPSPYAIATVQLEEQASLRVSTMLTGCEPSAMQIGMAVELDWIERDGVPYPVFRPRERSQS